jgi:hypothetical protein
LANSSFSSLFLTAPIIVVSIVFAIVGFLLDGFETTREMFSPMCGSLGFLAMGIIGVMAASITAAIRETLDSPSIATLKIMMLTVFISAIAGFVWNAIQPTREFFSLHRSLAGIICGFLRGVLTCIFLLFSGGCGTLVLAAVLSALTAILATCIIVFYTLKGFILFGVGGEWDDL